MPIASDRRRRISRRLAQAGLPTPGGFCITARRIGGRSSISDCRRGARIPERRPADATPAVGRDQAEALSKRPRAGSLAQILAAWREEPKPAAVRSSALIEDRADTNFAGQFESFLGRQRRRRILHRAARLLGGAVDHQCAPLHGAARSRSRRYRDGGAGAAARRRARLGRRFERDRRRPHAAQRHLGARLGDRARRSRAGPHRAQPPRFFAQQRSRPQASPRSLRAWRRHAAAGGAGSAGRARRASKPARQQRSDA